MKLLFLIKLLGRLIHKALEKWKHGCHNEKEEVYPHPLSADPAEVEGWDDDDQHAFVQPQASRHWGVPSCGQVIIQDRVGEDASARCKPLDEERNESRPERRHEHDETVSEDRNETQ